MGPGGGRGALVRAAPSLRAQPLRRGDARSPCIFNPPLSSPPRADWREQTILRFRVARKRALALTLERIQAAMATAASAAPCGSDGNECSDGEDSDPRQYEVGGGEAGGGAAAAAGGSREEL